MNNNMQEEKLQEEVIIFHLTLILLGAFAKVCLAYHKKTKERVVWKVFEKTALVEKSR